MSSPRRFVRRAVFAVVVASMLCLGPTATVAQAWAHVEASSGDAVRGGVALVSFQVPNESTTGAATTALTIDLTSVSAVRIEAKAGWATKVDRDAASGAVRSATWTAGPNGGIAPDEFGIFRISVKLPDAEAVSFPATQTYADGAVVKWDQPSVTGQAEPEHPAPTLVVNDATASHPHAATTGSAQPTATATPATPGRPAADNTARMLAGAALLLGAVGIGAALIVRRT